MKALVAAVKKGLRGPVQGVRRSVRSLLARVLRWALARPFSQAMVTRVQGRFPGVIALGKRFARRYVLQQGVPDSGSSVDGLTDFQQLSPRGREYYRLLQSRVQHRAR